ncbi:MAG: hypothetical protein Q7S56_00105 [Nanoarchaeota archaeon]|nr:hypothetical protein [Nanoarchaeota archaeon]
MQEIVKILIGLVILGLGIPIGDFLRKQTKEELNAGRKWFGIIILICLVGAVITLIWKDDALLFGLLFIAIVTSRSLKFRKNNKKKKR